MAEIADLRHRLAAIAAGPEDAPRGLPGCFYTDPDWFAWEAQTMLRRGWHGVAREDEIAQAGDYLVIDLLGEPVLLVRDQDGNVRAFSNLCRHRGMPLAEGRGTAPRFVCPYHAWAYDLDGRLLRAARMKNADFDPAKCRLPEFGAAVAHGFIYVCLQPEQGFAADPSLDALLAPYDPGAFRIVHQAEEIWACNWKSLVENFMEGYHLSVVHPQTLHGYTPTGLSQKGPDGPGFTSYFANYPAAVSRGVGAPGLDMEARQRSSLFAVFPTQVASQAATLLVALAIAPLAVDRIRVRWTMSAYGDELDAATLAARIGLWEEVNREDREKLERMQGALSSVHADGGYLAGADYEGTVRDFHRWLAAEDARS